MPPKKTRFQRQTEQIDEVIRGEYIPEEHWNEDPQGYFLIRINPDKKLIEVGYVTRDHVIRKKIEGTHAIEIYYAIIRHKLLSRYEHAAYLGKELYKAELALKYGKKYRQSFPLDLPLPEAVHLSKQS